MIQREYGVSLINLLDIAEICVKFCLNPKRTHRQWTYTSSGSPQVTVVAQGTRIKYGNELLKKIMSCVAN